jgi:hypothetical protein
VEATPAYRTEEINATRTMVDRVEKRFELKPTDHRRRRGRLTRSEKFGYIAMPAGVFGGVWIVLGWFIGKPVRSSKSATASHGLRLRSER